jgi:hypothetical protein
MKLFLKPKPGETIKYLGLGSFRGDYYRRAISVTPVDGFNVQLVRINTVVNPRALRGVLGPYLLFEDPGNGFDYTLETTVTKGFPRAPSPVHLKAEWISTIVSAEMMSDTQYAAAFERELRNRLVRFINLKAKGLGVTHEISGADLRIRFDMQPVPDDPEHVRCSVTSSELYLAVISSRPSEILQRANFR